MQLLLINKFLKRLEISLNKLEIYLFSRVIYFLYPVKHVNGSNVRKLCDRLDEHLVHQTEVASCYLAGDATATVDL